MSDSCVPDYHSLTAFSLSLLFSFSPRCIISTASWGEELTDWVAFWVIPRGLLQAMRKKVASSKMDTKRRKGTVNWTSMRWEIQKENKNRDGRKHRKILQEAYNCRAPSFFLTLKNSCFQISSVLFFTSESFPFSFLAPLPSSLLCRGNKSRTGAFSSLPSTLLSGDNTAKSCWGQLACINRKNTMLQDITWLILYVSITLSAVNGMGIVKKLWRRKSLSFWIAPPVLHISL